MKQLIIAAFLLVSCTNIEKEADVQAVTRIQPKGDRFGNVDTYDYTASGMKYKVFTGGSYASGIFVVNLTKDSLEAAVKKEELNSYHNFRDNE